MNFPDKLRYYRKKNKMTQNGLGDLLNVSRKTISGWENSRNYPDINTLIKISDLFGISLEELIKDNDFIKNTDHKINKYKNNNKYKKTMIFINAFMIIMGYIELIGIFQIHIPSISFILFMIVLFSFHLLKIEQNYIFSNIYLNVFFIIILLINIILVLYMHNFTYLLINNTEIYLKGFIIGKLILLLLISFLILLEINLIGSKKNSNHN